VNEMITVETGKPTQMKAMKVTKPYAPALPELAPAQELALLARCLFSEGYDDHLAGHITYKQPDATFLVNPFGLTWDELRASDLMHMDADGTELDGPWTITPAITLHVELHKARHDVRVAIHNHSRWGTIWADIGRAPEVYDQTSALYHGEVAVYDEYWGAVDDSPQRAGGRAGNGRRQRRAPRQPWRPDTGQGHRAGLPAGHVLRVALPAGLAHRRRRGRHADEP
jgi:L-fuculose-phosphate aldolase